MNDDVHNKVSKIADVVRKRRLTCSDHVVRMNDDRRVLDTRLGVSTQT